MTNEQTNKIIHYVECGEMGNAFYILIDILQQQQFEIEELKAHGTKVTGISLIKTENNATDSP